MKTKTKTALVAALFFAVCAPMTLTAASSDEAAIRELSASFVAAWNTHNPAAMAATWAEDGDLINPAGRVAKGRNEVEKLLTEEHATVMKGTTLTLADFELSMLSPDIATADWSIEIAGATGPDGKPMPPNPMHVFIVFEKHGAKWLAQETRPYAFLPPPPPPAKS